MAQQYFTDSEWTALLKAPSQAIMAIILADKTDPVSFLKEAHGAIKVLINEQQRTDISSDLVKSLIAAHQQLDAQETLQGEELILKKEFELLGAIQAMKDAGSGREQAIAQLQQVSSILTTKVTGIQAQEFKTWLLSLAQKVAETVKEEGLFGIGGERVSGAERAILEKLEKALSF